MAQTVIHEVLAGLIDYAGLFPPAGLAMIEATRLYQSYLWMTAAGSCARRIFLPVVRRVSRWR
jgi:hypothetical protein